jgi:PAS domain S-box-containing protein
MTVCNYLPVTINPGSRKITKQIRENLEIINMQSNSKPDHWFDVIIADSLPMIRSMRKSFPATLFVFITRSINRKSLSNVICLPPSSLQEDGLGIFFNTVYFASSKLKESTFRKVAAEVRGKRELALIKHRVKKLGFSLHIIKKIAANNHWDQYLKDKVGNKKSGFIFDNILLRGFFFNKNSVLYFFESQWLLRSELPLNLLKELRYAIHHSNLFFDRRKKHSTEMVQAAVSLEKERFLAEHIGEGFFIQDMAGKIYFINKTFRKMFPLKKNMIFGKRIQDVLHAGEKFNLVELWEKNSYNPFSVLFTGNNFGETRFFDVTYSPVIKDGVIKNFCGIISDVTLEKKLEGALRQSKDKLEIMNSKLVSVQNATILGFSKLAEYKDMETGGHLERMQRFVEVLTFEVHKQQLFIDFETKKNYISSAYVEELALSSLLHDIGKVGIPDIILQKPGRLTQDEFLQMKNHTRIGGDTLTWLNQSVGEETFLALAKEVAYYHHEKWNGSGYPFGLKEDNIPLSARLIAICDVYDALTSKRSYKNAYSHEKACEIIYNSSGTHFDPILISAFSSVEDKFKVINQKFCE